LPVTAKVCDKQRSDRKTPLDWEAATSGIEPERFFLGFGTALTGAAQRNENHRTQKDYLRQE
jgi:hypothetical protein